MLRRATSLAVLLAGLYAAAAPAAPPADPALTITASPAVIIATGTATITASMPGAPDNTPVTFTALGGVLSDQQATLTGTNRTATAVFTSDQATGRTVTATALGKTATVTFKDAAAPLVITSVDHDDSGNLTATIVAGDTPTVSCAFSYTHDTDTQSGTPVRFDGTLDDSGNCTGTIDEGLSPGVWSIAANATDADGNVATNGDRFTLGDDFTPPGDGTGTYSDGTDPSTDADATDGGAPSGVDANAALLQCSKSSIAITDLAIRDGRVRVLGVTTPGNAGKPIHIAFASAGNVVATVKAAADGSFHATAPRPAHAIAVSDHARYRATIGTAVTPWLKLTRRLEATGLHKSGTDLEVGGTLQKPFAKGTTVTITTQSDCSVPPTVIGHVPVAADGRFYRVIGIPGSATGFIVRLSAKVVSPGGGQTPTYSIARPVQIRPGGDPAAGSSTPPVNIQHRR